MTSEVDHGRDFVPRPFLRSLLAVAAFVVVVAGLKAASVIVVPILLAAFLAIVLSPAYVTLTRRGLPEWVALIFVACILLAVCTVIGMTVKTSFLTFYHERETFFTKLELQKNDTLVQLAEFGIELPEDILGEMDPQTTLAWLETGWTTFRGVLTGAFLTLFLLLFMLLEVAGFPEKLAAISEDRVDSLNRVHEILANVRRYLVIKTLISLLTGLLIWLFLLAIGVRFALLWAFLAFLLNYVPNIGSIIAAIPAMTFVLVESSPGMVVVVGLGYLAANTVCGNLLEPRVMGHGMGLSPLVVFTSLLFWGYVLGPVGMLLSVPLTMAAKVTLDSREETRWIAILLGPDHALREAGPPALPAPAPRSPAEHESETGTT